MLTTSQAQTERIGISLAACLRPGDVVLLRGPLGAGKTALARGIAQGLGAGPVSSPTFTLLHCHEGRLPLRHFDLYRLDGAEAFWAVGLDDYMGGDAISLIEWPERAEEAMPARRLEVCLAYGDAEEERHIRLSPVGGFREVAL